MWDYYIPVSDMEELPDDKIDKAGHYTQPSQRGRK